MSQSKSHGGSLTIYVDPVSPYSLFGYTSTLKFRPSLQHHGVSVDIIPFFLGASRENMGNPFSHTPKYRQAFGAQDLELTAKLLGLEVRRPSVFPISSLMAVRVSVYVKDHYPAEKFEATYQAFSSGYWIRDLNISKPEVIVQILGEIFLKDEVEKIMEGAVSKENKKRVMDLTLGAKAFGAPWIVAVNEQGAKREWFGNDRWDQIFDHLKLQFEGVKILVSEGNRRSGVDAKL